MPNGGKPHIQAMTATVVQNHTPTGTSLSFSLVNLAL